MSGADGFLHFRPSGPVASAFLADTTSKVRFLRGPVGGGKTVSCVFDCVKQASSMPVCRDGEIHYRVAVAGVTYGQLERNLYPTWHFWLPKDGGWTEGEWIGGGGRFAQQKLRWKIVRNGREVIVNFTAIFAAIGELSIEQFVRGFEPTAWYLYEVDQFADGIVEQAIGRLGRYPNASMLPDGASYRGYVVGDLNSPDIDSWYYKLIEETRPEGMTQFVQPSGLSSRAENLQNLRDGYYQNLYEINKHKPKWVKRFILNEYGPSDDGQPVYPEYADDVHLVRTGIPYDPTLPLYLGFDQGLTQPAMVVVQRARNGQWRVIYEVVPGRMNGRRFAKLCVQVLGEIAPGWKVAGAWADPAGFAGADKEAGELAWAETVSAEMGVPILPAPTNEIDPRLTAVKDELTFMIDGSTPGLVVSGAGCPILRKGFASDYCYRKVRVGNRDRYDVKPDKTRVCANPHDGLQYVMLGVKGRAGVVHGRAAEVHALQAQSTGSTRIKSDFLDCEAW